MGMTNTRGRIAGLGVAAVLVLSGFQWNAVQNASAGSPARSAERPASAGKLRTTFRTTTTALPRVNVPVPQPAPATTVAPAPPTTQAAPTTVAPAPAPTTTRPPTTTAPPPAPAPTVTTPPAPPVPAGFLSTATQSEMLAQVNARRATGTTCGGVAYPPVPALSLQSNLRAAADAHALDMATYNYFSHTGRNGSDPGDRITAAGYRWSAWAENIAAGQGTATLAVNGWFASAGHCVNFMSSVATQIGFGGAQNPSSTYKIYWVAELGRPA